MSEFKIQDLSSNHKYRTELPNILFELGLHPCLIGVYAALKRCAGDYGNCTKSIKTLCNQLQIAKNTLKAWLRDLCKINPILNKPLITLQERSSEHGDSDTHSISIIDIWPDNFKFFDDKNRGGSKFDLPGSKTDPRGSKFTPGVGQNLTGGGSNFDPKEEPIEEEPNKEEQYSREALGQKVINADFLNSLSNQNTYQPSKNEDKVDITYTIRPTNSNESETKSNKNTEKEKKQELKLSLGEDGNVKLTQKEYDNLLTQMDERERADWIETIRLEIGKKGEKYFSNKYKSHYHTILSWKRREEKMNPKPKPSTVEKKEVKQDPNTQRVIQENKTYAKDMAYKFMSTNVIYNQRETALEIKIKRGGKSDKFYQISYLSNDFKNQVIEILRECNTK